MTREVKLDLLHSYVYYLVEKQIWDVGYRAEICFGGFVFDDTRVDLYEVFDRSKPEAEELFRLVEDYEDCDDLIVKICGECTENIGSLEQYLKDRGEYDLVREGKEPVAYIQMPSYIWDEMYWKNQDEYPEYLVEQFEGVMRLYNLDYDLTTYGRNAVLVYENEDKE